MAVSKYNSRKDGPITITGKDGDDDSGPTYRCQPMADIEFDRYTAIPELNDYDTAGDWIRAFGISSGRYAICSSTNSRRSFEQGFQICGTSCRSGRRMTIARIECSGLPER